MLGRVTASEVIREANSGRTRPVLMLCDADTDEAIEVFCKLSAGCFDGVTSLAREVVAACLAIDLNLPVPTPYVVEIPSALASVVTDPEIAERLGASSPVGFGSAKVANQFSAWTVGHRVTEFTLPSALGAFVFDAVIDNADRRPSNPNCLVAGERLHLIDHELAFPSTAGLPGWRPPWQAGALSWLDRADGHLFCRELKMRRPRFWPSAATMVRNIRQPAAGIPAGHTAGMGNGPSGRGGGAGPGSQCKGQSGRRHRRDKAGAAMTEKQAYSYTVLRYIHDVVSGEALNAGVVMHAPAASFLKVRTRKTIGRLKHAFPDLDRTTFVNAMQAVDRGFSTVAKQANTMALFDARTDARAHALKVLPDDDSALQWSQTGTGLTADPARAFERLYERYVARYDSAPAKRRSDADVWQPVHDKLMERGINIPFEPRTVAGTQDQIVFEKAWKNGGWHACEPVSLAHGQRRTHHVQGAQVARPSRGRRRRGERTDRSALSAGPPAERCAHGRLRGRQGDPGKCPLFDRGC